MSMKQTPNAQQVKKLIKKQFPQWQNLPIQSVKPQGWDNITFRLGTTMLVRLPTADCYAVQVAKEQTWLPKLAPELPLAIPKPLARGTSTKEYPWDWSIYEWIEGQVTTLETILSMEQFAYDLAHFLQAFEKINTSEGPQPGLHNFYRGGSLAVYDTETRNVLKQLENVIDCKKALDLWEYAVNTTWNQPPVWVHGDIAPNNLLIKNGKLHAVIDFGCLAIGDPACDLALAWTFFDNKTRTLFKNCFSFNQETWERARGWVLWKNALTCASKTVTVTNRNKALTTLKEIIKD